MFIFSLHRVWVGFCHLGLLAVTCLTPRGMRKCQSIRTESFKTRRPANFYCQIPRRFSMWDVFFKPGERITIKTGISLKKKRRRYLIMQHITKLVGDADRTFFLNVVLQKKKKKNSMMIFYCSECVCYYEFSEVSSVTRSIILISKLSLHAGKTILALMNF